METKTRIAIVGCGNISDIYIKNCLASGPDVVACAEVSCVALNAGKHVYSEKPLATNRTDREELLKLARPRGLRIGCAPDTFPDGALQTCRGALGHFGFLKPEKTTFMETV